jgi:pimeloyl-ACP methyl ester carboxylesterase
MWQPQLDDLGKGWRLLIPDLRGYGKSALPNGPFAYHADVAALLEALAVPSAWVVGISFGSQVALDFSLAYPEKVRGLVLISPLIAGLETSAALAAFAEEEDRLLEAGDLAAATELNVRTWVDGPHRSPDQVDAQVRASVAQMQHDAFRVPEPEGARVIHLEPPARERLHEVQVPTLILAGELDLQDVLDHAQVLAAQIPDARLERVSGVAHMLTREAPARVNALMKGFIQGQ